MSYASLVVPRRTKCPPVVQANNVSRTRTWFDPERALAADILRKKCPLHYHLSRYDVSAIWATIKEGADPAKRDAAGRTVLDLAVEMAFELLEICLCTSTAVDNVDTSPTALLRRSSGSPEQTNDLVIINPLVAKYKEACNNMYEHSDRMRYEASATGRDLRLQQPRPILVRSLEEAEDAVKKRFTPVFQPQEYRKKDIYSSKEQGASSAFPLPQEDAPNFYPPQRARPQQFTYAFDEKGRPSAWDLLQREQARLKAHQLQQSFLVVVSDFLQTPPNKAAATQMRDLIRRLNLLLTVVKKLSAYLPLRREAAEKAGDYLENRLTYPYLYIATVHQLFRRYPKALNGEVWDVCNPADSRRLVLTIQALRLRGNELLSFLGTVCRLLSTLMGFLGVPDPRIRFNTKGGCVGGECSQYYLHMAFTLDDVDLFQRLIVFPRLFCRRDVFKWEDLLYTLMEYREQFQDYLDSLLMKRLKARVQKRLVDDADAKAEFMPETVKYPCEERYLTRHLLQGYGDIFGPQEAKEFSTMLRHWRYGAARAVSRQQTG